MLIQPENIVDIVFARKIQSLHFKPVDIEAAQYVYFTDVFGRDFADLVTTTPADYETFLTDYVNPVLAFATVVMNFNRIFTEITDRGINVFQNTGAQQASESDRQKLLQEYDRTLQVLVRKMIDYVELMQELNDADYLDAVVNDKFSEFDRVKVWGKKYKVTHV